MQIRGRRISLAGDVQAVLAPSTAGPWVRLLRFPPQPSAPVALVVPLPSAQVTV